MPVPNEKGECRCGNLARLAGDPTCPVEFDEHLNEFHLTHIIPNGGGYTVIRFCPFCGGSAPQSRRDSLIRGISDAERQRLYDLTKDLRTMQDVIAVFGEPDAGPPMGKIVTIPPEKEGMPETTERYPIRTYSKLSDVADVHVTVYSANKIEITFQGKGTMLTQTHQHHRDVLGAKPPEPEPQINTSKRYDVYCTEPHQRVVVYRSALFKGAGSLLTPPGVRSGHSQFVELEQTNGQSVFISRGSIFRFCEPGAVSTAEAVVPK
jgi:hypothetical protein